MIGAHLDRNVFKCAQLTQVASGPFIDFGTLRNGMHACPYGAIMIGFHRNKNYLACQYPGPSVASEYVDGNPATLDSYPMHVCWSAQYAMSGIHDDHNQFTCAR